MIGPFSPHGSGGSSRDPQAVRFRSKHSGLAPEKLEGLAAVPSRL
ncbi:MAG TPA: hypothetical protein VMV10_15270 [Pirellulales bacterium]|nr:hypothetical protein [Pirellulales bacterium]